ncbi:claudin-19-like isoform X1 [Anguilla anguilla]|uniref:Claudin n=1 Tax=Anguilla anguilla TaxID=7936 RepID=A0A0E9X8G1_ANGAN|nr:claudin-19-like isoform X1 [Anguilla anguilla]
MAVLGLQILGLLLGLLGWILESSCTSSHAWKEKSHVDSVTSSSRQYQGLWMECAATSSGSVQCNTYKTVLGLPGYVQACRALMIVTLLLGLAGIVVSLLGLKCTKIGSASKETKGKIALTGGGLFLLSGISCLIAASWYAARVVQEFYDPFFGGVKFELGAGLYMGWGGASLAILGGAFLCCSCKQAVGAPPKGGNYGYNYSTAGQDQKIFRQAPATDSGTSKAYV